MRVIDSSNELSKSMNSEESSRFSKIQSIANDIHERTGVDRSKALEFMGGISRGLDCVNKFCVSSNFHNPIFS